jgi:dTDP-4-dehydrorhamnose reductase
MLQAINRAVGKPTVTLDMADTALKVMKRRLKDADVYLLFNEGPNTSTHTITLPSRVKQRFGMRKRQRSQS